MSTLDDIHKNTDIEQMRATIEQMHAENQKLAAETKKVTLDMKLAPYFLGISALTSGGAILLGIAAIAKLIWGK